MPRVVSCPIFVSALIAVWRAGRRRRGADTRVCSVETRLDAFRECTRFGPRSCRRLAPHVRVAKPHRASTRVSTRQTRVSAPQVRQAVFGLGLLFLCWGLAAQDAAKPLESVKKSEQKQGGEAAQKGGAAIEDDRPPGQVNPEPPKGQPVSIVLPHTSDPLQGLWYAIMGISGLSFLALGYAAWRLKAVGPPPAPNLEPLLSQLSTIRQQASLARSRYDDLARRASQPAPRPDPAPPSPQVGKEPYESKPPAIRLTPQPLLPISPARTAPRAGGSNLDWSPRIRPRDELVEAYHLARTSADRIARDQFDNRYPYVRISCINHDEWQFHKNITLRFQASDFGWYLMVSRGGNHQAFPWFTQDLAHERESFKGVFEYPEGSGDAKLRLVRPALLQSQGDGWILTSPGEVQADV